MSDFLEWVLIVGITIWLTLWLAPVETYFNRKRNVDKAVWLEKMNMFGQWEKTAVFIGYYNNITACIDFKAAYTEKYHADQYRCSGVD